jgi:hypothetical protein
MRKKRNSRERNKSSKYFVERYLLGYYWQGPSINKFRLHVHEKEEEFQRKKQEFKIFCREIFTRLLLARTKYKQV